MHGDRMIECQKYRHALCVIMACFFNLFEVQLQCYLHIMEVDVKSAF